MPEKVPPVPFDKDKSLQDMLRRVNAMASDAKQKANVVLGSELGDRPRDTTGNLPPSATSQSEQILSKRDRGEGVSPGTSTASRRGGIRAPRAWEDEDAVDLKMVRLSKNDQ